MLYAPLLSLSSNTSNKKRHAVRIESRENGGMATPDYKASAAQDGLTGKCG